MGKPIVRDFTQGKGILKFFPYQGAACVVPQSMKSDADANGKKIVPAGTPFPSNNDECLGYLLEDVDVSHFQSQMQLELQHLELLSMVHQRLQQVKAKRR